MGKNGTGERGWGGRTVDDDEVLANAGVVARKDGAELLEDARELLLGVLLRDVGLHSAHGPK